MRDRGALGDARLLADGSAAHVMKEPLPVAAFLVPARGVALLINAFNFPAWGLWEKAAAALLSGVPVIEASHRDRLVTHRMVADVLSAGILPAGALSIVCGSSAGLLDQLQLFDLVSFTGSAATAARVRTHPAIARHSVRVNIEADSLNCAFLCRTSPAIRPANLM